MEGGKLESQASEFILFMNKKGGVDRECPVPGCQVGLSSSFDLGGLSLQITATPSEPFVD